MSDATTPAQLLHADLTAHISSILTQLETATPERTVILRLELVSTRMERLELEVEELRAKVARFEFEGEHELVPRVVWRDLCKAAGVEP